MLITWIKIAQDCEILTQSWFHVGPFLVKLAKNMYKTYQYVANLRNSTNKYPRLYQVASTFPILHSNLGCICDQHVANILSTSCHENTNIHPTFCQDVDNILPTLYQYLSNILSRGRQVTTTK